MTGDIQYAKRTDEARASQTKASCETLVHQTLMQGSSILRHARDLGFGDYLEMMTRQESPCLKDSTDDIDKVGSATKPHPAFSTPNPNTAEPQMGASQIRGTVFGCKLGVPFRGTCNKDSVFSRVYIGVPSFWENFPNKHSILSPKSQI